MDEATGDVVQTPTTPSSDTSQAAGGEYNVGTQQVGTYIFTEGQNGNLIPDYSKEAQAAMQEEAKRNLEANGAGSGATGTGTGAVSSGKPTDAQATAPGKPTDAVSIQAGEAVTPEYLADWQGGTTFTDAIRKGDKSIAEYMTDYNKFAKATGGEPLDIFEMMNAIQGRDVNKSVAQNEADEKKLARRERWQQFGNLLAHLGNFIGTAAFGAPSQTIESSTELTKRQQALRDKTLALRNTYNQNLLAQLWKDRADQRAAEKALADIGLVKQRVLALQNDDARKEKLNTANVDVAKARKEQLESATGLNNERAVTEKEMRAPKIANMKSSTNAHNASAAASRAHAAASGSTAKGNNYKANRYKIWAENKRKHPNDFKQFMQDNNIHSWDRKLIDQFNGWIEDKHSNSGGSGGSGAAALLD